jgi:predicted nucleotidyltransferase
VEEGRPSKWNRPDVAAAEVCAELNRTGAEYLVIGGLACILHGHVRATADLDILINPTLENAARVLEALSETGYGFAREWLPDELVKKPITIIGDDPAVDIFTVAWSVKYRDALPRSSTVTVSGVRIPLIGLDDLIATKRTGRAQDTADLEVLEEIRRLRAGGAGGG